MEEGFGKYIPRYTHCSCSSYSFHLCRYYTLILVVIPCSTNEHLVERRIPGSQKFTSGSKLNHFSNLYHVRQPRPFFFFTEQEEYAPAEMGPPRASPIYSFIFRLQIINKKITEEEELTRYIDLRPKTEPLRFIFDRCGGYWLIDWLILMACKTV